MKQIIYSYSFIFIVGAFGEIYAAEIADDQSGKKYAVKFESLNTKMPQLQVESQFQMTLNNEGGFPRCYGLFKTSTDIILVMDMLGKNLKELFELCNKKFSVKTVLYIAIQTITRMETLHGKKFVYFD